MANSKRNFALDVLRGLAILLVIVHHLALPFRIPINEGPIAEFLGRRVINFLSYSGYEAVFIFFVLSGFLITQRALERYGALSKIDLKQFYFQRAKRILPLLLALLLLLSVLHGLKVPHFTIKGEGQTWFGALFSALFLHLNWYEGQTSWLPGAWDVLWSLSIEEVFYLSFPLLCLYLRSGVLVSLLLILAASLPITRAALAGQEIWQEKAYLPGFSAIAIGVLTAIAAKRFVPSRNFLASLSVAGSMILIGTLFFGNELWRRLADSTLLLHCCGAAALTWGASAWTAEAKAKWFAYLRVCLAWLAAMGKLSYELYLTHMLVVFPFVALIQRVAESQRAWWILSYPGALLLCMVVARLAERWVSRPAAAWADRRWGELRS